MAIESKLDAKDMKVGLLAIMVKGDSPSTPVLDPKISKFIVLVVAGGRGFSSSRLSIFGSKVVSDVQSNGLVGLGVTCRISGEMTEGTGDVLYSELSGENCLDTVAEESG